MLLLDTASEALNKAWEAASQDIYNAQQSEQAEGATAGGVDNNAGNAGAVVEDVSFEEVK